MRSVGTVLGGFRSPGVRSGDSQVDGGFRAEGPAGAEELAGVLGSDVLG